jgi:hypothetical protein
MFKILGATVLSPPGAPLRVWWDAEITTSDGTVHRNAPVPTPDGADAGTGVQFGMGGYSFAVPGDPHGGDLHTPEAARALAEATTRSGIMAAIELDIARAERELESAIAARAAAYVPVDLLNGGDQ